MRKYTLDEIMALKPCYSREQLEEHFRSGTITAKQIVKADVSHSDKLWVLIRLLKPADFVTFACDCAERVLHIFEEEFPDDNRPRKAIEVARSGNRDAAYAAAAAFAAARTIAFAAARTIARAAADAAADAAYAAAGAAAYAAAGDAADAADAAADAAGAAAYAAYAAYAAAGAAEQKWQLNRLLELINEAEKNNNQPL
jgi:hypothetical protein